MNIVAMKTGRKGIKFEAVAAIAEQISKAGGKPTLRGIREHLGSGSLGTIQKHLADWQSGRTPRETGATTLPDHVQSAIMAEIARQVQTARDELAEQVDLANQEREELTSENERLEQLIQDQAEQIEQLKCELAKQSGMLETMKDQVNDLKSRVDNERKKTESAEKERESARVAEQACKSRLEAAAREIEVVRGMLKDAQWNERKIIEETAELRGKLEALTEKAKSKAQKPKTETPK